MGGGDQFPFDVGGVKACRVTRSKRRVELGSTEGRFDCVLAQVEAAVPASARSRCSMASMGVASAGRPWSSCRGGAARSRFQLLVVAISRPGPEAVRFSTLQ